MLNYALAYLGLGVPLTIQSYVKSIFEQIPKKGTNAL